MIQHNSTAAVLVSAEASGTTIRLGSGVSGTIITPISLWRKLAIAQGETRFAVSVESLANKLAIAQSETAFILSAESLARKIGTAQSESAFIANGEALANKLALAQSESGIIVNIETLAKKLVSAQSDTVIIIGVESLANKLAVGWGTPTVYLSQYGQWVKYVSGEGSEIVIINPEAFGKRIIGEVIATMQIIGRDVSLSTRPVGADIIVLLPGRGQIKVTNT